VRRLDCASIALAMVFAPIAPAFGADEPPPDRAMIRLGGYGVRDAETLVRLDSNNAPVGLYIDFEDTLGGETSANVVRLDGLYRFDGRHALGYSWYALKFTGYKAIETDIQWGDQSYTLGTQIDSEVRFDIYKLNYQYSLFHSEVVELGVLAGLHVMRTSVALGATGASQVRESVNSPLPVFGVFANHRLSPRWRAHFNYQLFFVNYEDQVQGGLQDLTVGLEYRLTRDFALGTALSGFSLDLEARDESSTLRVNTQWSGWMFYASQYF